MEATVESYQIKPIGLFHSTKKYPYEAARQSGIDSDHTGYIQLFEKNLFEQGLELLDGFSRIWIIYHFHHNTEWKPKVRPPRPPIDSDGQIQKVGVFASRSPYRPNPIGLSSVELLKIQGLQIFVSGADLLDQTPIWDIKPYIPYADSFPDESTGWLAEIGPKFQVSFSELSINQIHFLNEKGITEIQDFLKHQLEYQPTSKKQKRVYALNNGHYEIAYRTWRAEFSMNDTDQTIQVLKIYSGYSRLDLIDPIDKYQDKAIHQAFLIEFDQSLALDNKK